ncbi:hypothetical protein C7974DRAFT_380836 [Boeremia exigua]|uniref:uncharacterized protein n=1 Tax=Boeremia exigua TaxID=749465 RepID=UPI001E8DCB6C|nr:uncharacterized protein C7974DRAFT_380836 [Boeremia exigua]KAH6613123.1 hypothetical protein C7974DRAFT_380836 [Boeremia exigua]
MNVKKCPCFDQPHHVWICTNPQCTESSVDILQRLSRMLPTNPDRVTATSFITLSTWPSCVSAGQTHEPLRFFTPTTSSQTLEMSDCPPRTFYSAKAGSTSQLFLPPFRGPANREHTPPLSRNLIKVPSRTQVRRNKRQLRKSRSSTSLTPRTRILLPEISRCIPSIDTHRANPGITSSPPSSSRPRTIPTRHDSTGTSTVHKRNHEPLALFRPRPEAIFSPSVPKNPPCLRTSKSLARAGPDAQADADVGADTPTGTSVPTARDLAENGASVDADAETGASTIFDPAGSFDADARTFAESQALTDALAATTAT